LLTATILAFLLASSPFFSGSSQGAVILNLVIRDVTSSSALLGWVFIPAHWNLRLTVAAVIAMFGIRPLMNWPVSPLNEEITGVEGLTPVELGIEETILY
jgi:hypothetical protein